MKFGATLVLELVTKKQELFDMSDKRSLTKYNILCKGRKIYNNLTEEEFFDTMEDLAQEFYKSGTPDPSDIETEIIGD